MKPGLWFWATLASATPTFLGLLLLLDTERSRAASSSNRTDSSGVRAAFVAGKVKRSRAEGDLTYAVDSGIRWLLDHQFEDGMWSARAFSRMCVGDICNGTGSDHYDVAVTGLAVLALLESGRALELKTESSIRRALGWLAVQQDEAGCFGSREGKYLYGQAVAILAFCRGFRLLSDPVMKHHARRGLRFLEQAQTPGLGWRYGFRDGQSDSSVTAWVAAAVIAARGIDIETSRPMVQGILSWFRKMTGPTYYEVAYRERGKGTGAIRGVNDHFEENEALTALAAAARVGLGMDRGHRFIREAVRRLSWNLPVWNARGDSVDYYYWYAGAIALRTIEEEGSETRRLWNARLRGLLGRHQARDRCVDGSWDPVDKWGSQGGRVYATAMNLLTLALVRP